MTEQQPEQVIATPVGGNLDQELTQAKRGLGKVTLGLGVGVLVLAAFFGGVWVHSATAGTSATTAAPNGARPPGQGRLPGGVPPSGAPGAGGAGRAATAGTVERVEGTTVIIKMQDGTEVRVSTTDATRVELAQPGKISDLTAGSSVIVQGTRAEDNSVQAQAITKRPAPR